jgi:hypothetical protein
MRRAFRSGVKIELSGESLTYGSLSWISFGCRLRGRGVA